MVIASDQVLSTPRPSNSQDEDARNTQPTQRRDPKRNAATGASAAGVRAIASQMMAFYFRAPVKAFFPARVDYLAFARAINPRVQAKEPWSWRMSSPSLLTYAIRVHGWSIIPNHVLPPLMANIGVGAVLYTSYLQILGLLHKSSSQSLKKIYPPPLVYTSFAAGFMAGTIQSAIAAPVDALQLRFRTSDILGGKYKNVWDYGRRKLAEIGVRGVYSGWELSLLKDSFGYGIFFATFEYVKAQSYYAFVAKYYGGLSPYRRSMFLPKSSTERGTIIIKPHYAIGPTFLMLAGITATIAQQLVTYPISLVQTVHHGSLSRLQDQVISSRPRPWPRQNHSKGYEKTFQRCLVFVRRFGGWRRWLWRGFFLNTVKQVPSTSAGLVIFELVRRGYGTENEALSIEEDGYKILLT